jgi:hypothetical protein
VSQSSYSPDTWWKDLSVADAALESRCGEEGTGGASGRGRLVRPHC